MTEKKTLTIPGDLAERLGKLEAWVARKDEEEQRARLEAGRECAEFFERLEALGLAKRAS